MDNIYRTRIFEDRRAQVFCALHDYEIPRPRLLDDRIW